MRWTLLICIFYWSIVQTGAQDCNEGYFDHLRFVDIKSILSLNNCNTCHNSSADLWHFDSYSDMVYGDYCSNIPPIVHGDAGRSSIIAVLNGEKICSQISPVNHQISKEHLKDIERWINIGAPENCIKPYQEIKDILDKNNCYSCHNDNNATSWDYSDIDFNTPSKMCQPKSIIDIYNPINSSLMDVLYGTNCANDHVAVALTDEEVISVRDWIACGAIIENASLPLDLISFVLTSLEDKPFLIWETQSEIGVEKFVIQRSLGNGVFENVAEIPAKGNVQNRYSYMDKSVLIGNYYYRVKVMDYDGRHEYTPLKYIRLESNIFQFDLFPNPSTSNQEIFLIWYSKNNIQPSAKITLMNESGNFIQEYKIESGRNKIILPNLVQGVYYFRLFDFYGSSHFERIIVI